MTQAAPERVRKDLRAIVGDGVAFSVMVGAGETYLPAFALAVGLGDAAAGLLATLPMLAGAVLQLATPRGVRWLGSYRRWVVLCASLQALCFVPFVGAALIGRMGLPWLFAFAACYWAFGLATSPAWNAWVDALVPAGRRGRFFARRNQWSQAALFAAVVVGGLGLDSGRRAGVPVSGFALLFAAAGVARLVSAWCLSRQSEAPELLRAHRSLSLREVAARFRAGESARLLGYLLAMQAAVNVAAPFFTPYMLHELELSYAAYTALTAAAFLARILVLPGLGRFVQARGPATLLWMGAAGIVPLPLLWLVSDAFYYLLGLQVLSGAIWAALELAILLSFFDRLGADERTSILAVFNLANAVAMALGAVLGGLLLHELGSRGLAYTAVFGVSGAARLTSLALVSVGRLRARVRILPALRTLAVRPAVGALQRPVLTTLENAEAAEPPDAAPAPPHEGRGPGL